MSIAANFEKIRENIRNVGRDPAEITIVGAAKYQPLERIREALKDGLTDLGDNQLQAGESLRTQIGEGPRWHFIGHIQSRKAKGLTSYYMVHSLDRLKVAELLQRALEEAGQESLRILVEVNLGGEATKSGIAASELQNFLKQLRPLDRLRPEGLMCMPPPLDPPERRRPFFRTLRLLAEETGLGALSMGTSEDYWVALQEGATHIRLGSCLFGERVR
ncbi:MAG: YggS family pyridoxal phosphate-dependent enzyme [Bdellovibrionaceae bacterium]|nr:YggS family pyridoxal phosphate-dependent enzyme [Bdellovibrionales bacterium]MCB9254654.1 YggS family pyridoxal phosphate-dependent enzyme [Pseudobdellovibrionaceae bacterium]